MKVDERLIERIVGDVMEQLRTQQAGAHAAAKSHATDGVFVSESVITAEVLETRVKSTKRIHIAAGSLLTPSARDYLHTHQVEWDRGQPNGQPVNTSARWQAVVVTASPSIEAAFEADGRSIDARWERQLAGSTSEAVETAVSGICRAEADGIVIFCTETASAACLSNRNPRVRAAAIAGAGCIPRLKRELAANVYCIDPGGKNVFELRNVLRAIRTIGVPRSPSGSSS
jgi:hypothetical protein